MAAMLFATSCGDHSATDPGSLAPGRATLEIAPAFQSVAPGTPDIPLSKIVGILIGPDGDSTVSQANFVSEAATLNFDISFSGSSRTFTLDITAYDQQGIIAYHASQQIVVKPGRNPNLKAPTLIYAAPDSKLAVLKVGGGNTSLVAGGTTTFSVTGTGPNGTAISPIRVGWTSNDPTIATVDAAGVVQAGNFQGKTYIVARTALNVADSVSVSVKAPVDKVTLSPASSDLVRGKTATLVPDLRDGGNHVIDDRTPTWTTSDSTIATVSAAGVVTGVKIGTAKITATSEGKSATSTINVVTPIDHVELTPVSVAFASLTANAPLAAKLVPRAGATTDGIPVVYSSSDSTIVSVSDKGIVAAVSNGTAIITATADGLSAKTIVVVKQVASTITITPRAASVSAIGGTVQFTAAVFDALAFPITPPIVTWTSSDPTTATVSAAGVVTAVRAGSVTITAKSGEVSDVATFIVAPVVRLLLVLTDRTQINVGGTATLRTVLADANGNVINSTSATLTNTTPNIASLSGNVLTGLSAGTAHITATLGAFSGAVDIRVVGGGSGPGTLTVIPASVEKLPGGTQQFSVQEDVGVTWTVNGIPGGNSTFGTIDTEGFYRAPATVPNPSSFDVCATALTSTAHGCGRITINPVPTSGADVIVINDINAFDVNASASPDNIQFYKNLVNFTGSGTRSAGTKILFYNGHAAQYSIYSANAQFVSAMTGIGYTATESGGNITSPIDPQVKLLFLELPTLNFSASEINYLKAFSADGGRIVFVGEHSGFYGNGIPTENAFLVSMGAQMTNVGGGFDCITYHDEPASSLRPHQLTTGLSSLRVNCLSELVPGPNDYAIVYTQDGQHVIVGAAKVDVTPLPPGNNAAPNTNRAGVKRQVPAAPARTISIPKRQTNDPTRMPPDDVPSPAAAAIRKP